MSTEINLLFASFYLTVYQFHAKIQSSTCTTYSKYLRGSIMVVQTPNSGIGMLICVHAEAVLFLLI